MEDNQITVYKLGAGYKKFNIDVFINRSFDSVSDTSNMRIQIGDDIYYVNISDIENLLKQVSMRLDKSCPGW
ncbi:MAG TPA: hypothetical protein VNF93_00425 [Buchnera sp. (in: enterobacteria)]|nr:hypothetical protein [Buchnera sp. (in: enterobacteria)]